MRKRAIKITDRLKEGREEGRKEGRKEERKEGREGGRKEGRIEGKVYPGKLKPLPKQCFRWFCSVSCWC